MVMMTEAILSGFSGRNHFEFQDILVATPDIRSGAQHHECLA
jgi:hypothetical protein